VEDSRIERFFLISDGVVVYGDHHVEEMVYRAFVDLLSKEEVMKIDRKHGGSAISLPLRFKEGLTIGCTRRSS
jgi:hypothetical protein